MGNPPVPNLARNLLITASSPSTCGRIHPNSSLLGTFQPDITVLAAQRLKLCVGDRRIENYDAGQRFSVNAKERRHRLMLPLFAAPAYPMPSPATAWLTGSSAPAGRILPPEAGATSGRQRADKSFANLLKRAKIRNFRFHDLRHTFASWYMRCGGDLYELSKLLGHSNISMTERYAKLAQKHIMKTGSVSREIWSKLELEKQARKEIQETTSGQLSSPGCVRIVSAT